MQWLDDEDRRPRFSEILDNCHQTYPIVNVSTVLADPFTLPILGFLFLLSCFLSGRLFVTKDHVQRSCGWSLAHDPRARSYCESIRHRHEQNKKDCGNNGLHGDCLVNDCVKQGLGAEGLCDQRCERHRRPLSTGMLSSVNSISPSF